MTTVQSAGSTDVAEFGLTTDTYTVVLNTQPAVDVTITLTPDAQCTVAPTPLTFTNTNWNIAQTVTVTAVDDLIPEASPHPCVITHTLSGDATYASLPPFTLAANVSDNDAPGVTLTQSGGSIDISEAGTTSDSYTLVLNTQPATDVVITLTPDIQCLVSPSPVTFTSANWNVAQTITVAALDDALVESSPHPCVITHLLSGDALYAALTPFIVTANVSDNDSVPTPVAAAATPQIAVFDPAISKLGFLVSGQIGITGEQLEWVITVSNPSAATGNNVVVSDTLNAALRVDHVTTTQGTSSVNGQTVIVNIGSLPPGQTVLISIFTTVLNGSAVNNTACVTANNLTGSECARAIPVTVLPTTGETPLWTRWLLLIMVACIVMGRMAFRQRC
ncbi:MAG: hypothetical protein U0694_21180 [Anaerolineae bacterium]